LADSTGRRAPHLQLAELEPVLASLTDAEQARLWGRQTYYRALSQVNRPPRESDPPKA
jgi:hypothetical protein